MKRSLIIIAVLTLIIFSLSVSTQIAFAKEPYRIALSMSYVGNDWQATAKNFIWAVSKLYYKDKIKVDVYEAGASVPNQIHQLQQMIAKKYDAIMYPISSTTLNKVIQWGWDAGIVMMAYHSEVTVPCAYNTTFSPNGMGKVTAEWIAKTMS